MKCTSVVNPSASSPSVVSIAQASRYSEISLAMRQHQMCAREFPARLKSAARALAAKAYATGDSPLSCQSISRLVVMGLSAPRESVVRVAVPAASVLTSISRYEKMSMIPQYVRTTRASLTSVVQASALLRSVHRISGSLPRSSSQRSAKRSTARPRSVATVSAQRPCAPPTEATSSKTVHSVQNAALESRVVAMSAACLW